MRGGGAFVLVRRLDQAADVDLGEVAREVYRRTGMIMPSLYLWRIGYGMLPRILGAETAKKVAGHGADPVTSTAMHLFPELIRNDLIPKGLPQKTCTQLDIPFTALGSGNFDGAEVVALPANAIARLRSPSMP